MIDTTVEHEHLHHHHHSHAMPMVVSDTNSNDDSDEEDEASITSTLLVNPDVDLKFAEPLQHQQQQQRKRRFRRSVQFDLSRNVEHDYHHSTSTTSCLMSKSEMAQHLYYAPQDYKQFKYQQAQTIQQQQQGQRGGGGRWYSTFSSDSSSSSSSSSSSLISVLDRVYQTCLIQMGVLEEMEERDLEQVLQLETIGLEHRLATTWKYDRRERRRDLFDTILELQESCCEANPEALQLVLAEASRQRTQTSRCFAAYLAQAQYWGVRV